MIPAVPLFGKRPAGPSDAEREAAATDRERIAEGGIPLGAEQRLTKLANATEPQVFSSDLSTKEFALAQASGLQPLAQVMGSSVVQHGWRNYSWGMYGGGIQEMPSFAKPWNLSRTRSFERLRQEAAFAGADAVIGIEMTTKPFVDDRSQVEFVVFGTAVRETTLPRPPHHSADQGPRLCTLTGQDVDKLRRIGAETLDVIGHTAVVCVALDSWSNRQLGSWWSGNQEMPDISEGVYAARELVMREIERQGAHLGANDMVISALDHGIDHHEYEQNNYTHHFFIVSMHVLATAVRLGAHAPHPAPLGLPMMSINLGDQ